MTIGRFDALATFGPNVEVEFLQILHDVKLDHVHFSQSMGMEGFWKTIPLIGYTSFL